MRSLLALADWPEAAPPDGGWLGADARGCPMGLGYLGVAGMPDVATNERRTVRAVLIGSVYNGRELRATLAARHSVAAGDDAEIVIHLYEERGIQCVRALRGAFALALWDERRQRLLLARDQLGLQPLFFAVDHERLVAGSSLAVLARLPGLGDAWDAAALDAFLALGHVPPPATFYPAIRQLRPGELAVWERGRLRTQQYWQLTFPERRMTRADFPTLFRTQILEAVRLRQAGVVSGLLLSGGLDAAALLALATAERRPPATAYTVALADGDASEAVTAAELATRAGVRHVCLVEPPDWAAAVDALVAAAGSPIGALEAPLLGLAAARAAADGLDVLLAGIGGEEIFGGSPPAWHFDRLRRYRRLPGLAREGAELLARFAPQGWGAVLRRVIADQRLAPLEAYARAVSRLDPARRDALLTADARAAAGEVRPWGALAETFAGAVAAGAEDTADAVHYMELTLGLPARAVAAGTAVGTLDLRLPLADHRLAQFVASVPPVERGLGPERQRLLRGALEGLVPAPVLKVAHAALVPPALAWSRGSLRALVEDTLAPSRLAAHGVFRPDTVARLVAEQRAGTAEHAPLLWTILVTTRWLERRPATLAPRACAAG